MAEIDDKTDGHHSAAIDYNSSLKGTTYAVYRYIFKSRNPVRIGELQRDLKLSSRSVAQYHVNKLLGLELIREEQDGYVVNRVVFDNIIRFRRRSVPLYAAYSTVFGVALVALLTVLRPSQVTASYFFGLIVIAFALVISLVEAYRTVKRLG